MLKHLNCIRIKSTIIFYIIVGLAYREYQQNLKLDCEDELEFHYIRSDRSKCTRRPDFNRLYNIYCKDKYGSKNGKEMFENLEEKISEYQIRHPESAVELQRYEETEESVTPLILVIVTPLMKRVHLMVRWVCKLFI